MKKLFLFLITVMLVTNLSGAIFGVVNTADSGAGSLRDAINQANLNPGMDSIMFGIPGAGVQTIMPLSQLPQITDPAGVLIDGFSQPGSMNGGNPPSTCILMIEIDGSLAGGSHGLWIICSNNIIQGLIINNFEQDGIRIESPGFDVNNNWIYANFIGTDPSGTVAQGNGTNQMSLWAGVNILVTASTPGINHDNMVEGNLISSNYAEGVAICNCPPGDVFMNYVYFNYIGTDIMGMTDMGNIHDGVLIAEGAHDNVVGDNLISGNDFEGICIIGYAEESIITIGNQIIHNIIGMKVDYTPLANTMDGISIGQYGNIYQGGFAPDNYIDGNDIAYNGNNGITVWEHPMDNINCDNNMITQNSIHDNVWIGIDLDDDGVTLNDPGDPDMIANQDLNFPVITQAVNDNATGQTTISGKVDIDSDPTTAIVEVFKAAPDPTGYGEGEFFLGSVSPAADSTWIIIVSMGLAYGDSITATTTDIYRNTSEFCLNVMIDTVQGIKEKLSAKIDNRRIELFPNPFSSSITIKFSTLEKGHISLKIYDITGKLVKTIANGMYEVSSYRMKWNGINENGTKVTPGIYYCKLETEHYSSTNKIMMIR